MINPINQGTNCSTTQDWLRVTSHLSLTAYYPSAQPMAESAIEPGQAVNLSAAERTRMNHAMPGVRTRPDRF